MWFPIDQPAYQAEHTEELEMVRSLLAAADWKEGDVLPPFAQPFDEVMEELPANFDDDLHTKPEAHRQWRWDQQHGLWGHIDPGDKRAWLRHLDYYVKLHQLGDQSVGTVLAALEEVGAYDDTVVIYTSDHGDMCGSHGLRSKGPFLYDEIMRVPLYVKAPGVTGPGRVTDALSSAVDVVSTICGLAGVEPPPSVRGVDQGPVLADPSAEVRDHVLFAMDSAHTRNIQKTRYAVRGYFDGRYKYARYYGVGGGKPNDDFGPPTSKLYDVDADFDDQDHELYDHRDDPHELVNLAMDRGRRHEVRRHHSRLLELETEHFGPANAGL
jgi:arylsulfatase